MNRHRLPLLLGGLAGVALLLSLAAALFYNPLPPEDQQAEAYLVALSNSMSRGSVASEWAGTHGTTAAAMVRVMVRPDSLLTRMYCRVYDLMPTSLKQRYPRPIDGPERGVLVPVNLMNRTDAAEALPALAAFLTDPRIINREVGLKLFRHLGAMEPDELMNPALKGLEDTNALVQLHALESLQKVWPTQPDLTRRITELRHELKP